VSAQIELDETRHRALEKAARRRNVTVKRIVERAIDEFIERDDDEELLESSARAARRTGLKEKDAVKLVRAWRVGHDSLRKGTTTHR
jgi:predicted transcriptional regulator